MQLRDAVFHSPDDLSERENHAAGAGFLAELRK